MSTPVHFSLSNYLVFSYSVVLGAVVDIIYYTLYRGPERGARSYPGILLYHMEWFMEYIFVHDC